MCVGYCWFLPPAVWWGCTVGSESEAKAGSGSGALAALWGGGGEGLVPGGEGVGGGSVGVVEGLVGGEGGECGVGVLVGGGYVSVSSCPGVYVSAAEVLLDMRPRLGEACVPVVEQCVGSEAGWVCSGGERHRRGGDPGVVGLVGDVLLGGSAGAVAVVGDGEVVGAGVDEALQVVLGEGGSAGGDHVGEPGGVGGDGVGVSLHDSGCCGAADGFCGFVDAVEGVGFVVEGGGACVDIFGLSGVGSWECPPGEGDDVSGCVSDGEDNPGAEDVVGAAPSGVGHSGVDGCFVVSELVT